MIDNKDKIRLKHMLDAAQKALTFLKGRSRKDLDTDEMLLLSVLKLIEIIGEASARIEPNIKNKYPDIPWKEIINVRNRLIHGYFDINHDILWQISIDDLPPLIENLNKMINEN